MSEVNKHKGPHIQSMHAIVYYVQGEQKSKVHLTQELAIYMIVYFTDPHYPVNH